MQWINDNTRTAVLLAGVAGWCLYMFGPWVATATKSAALKVWPKVQGKVSLGQLLPLVFLVGVYVWPVPVTPTPVVPPRAPDIVDTCMASGRALLADSMDAFAAKKFDNDQAKEDAINEAILDVIEASFVPLNEEIAKAIKGNRVTDCADKIRKGELRSE